jgi:uncharacterized protein (TIGR03067 family)
LRVLTQEEKPMRVSMMAVFGVCGLISGGCLIATAAQDGAEKELKNLEGVYVMVSGQANGEKLPETIVKSAMLTVKGNKHTVKVGDDTIIGTHKLAPTKTPKEIDSADTEGPLQGQTYLGIYKLEKGVFTVYFAPPGKDRPKGFAKKTNPGEILHVWKKK